jgi:hypothetical protein
LLIPTAHAEADAALLPIPYPAGIFFLIFISIPSFILNFFFIADTTNPAVFFDGLNGISSELTMTIPFPFFVKITLSYSAFNAIPNTSNPGPKFAVEQGARTVTDFIINLLFLRLS